MDSIKDQFRSPGEALAHLLRERDWTQQDLATILDRPQKSISQIVTGKKGVTPETAIELSNAFGNDPVFWVELEARYRLSLVQPKKLGVEKRARLYQLAPVKEMVRRGWISDASSLEILESELRHFFDQPSIEDDIEIGAALRTSFDSKEINASQRAWCFRAKQMARAINAERYNESKFDQNMQKLRRLASWPNHASKISSALASMGIRFVVIEPLARTKIDGAALWLDENSPVVAMSARFDRIDSFWHTLAHELSHIKHRDNAPPDVNLVGDSKPSVDDQSSIERRADQDACRFLLDPDELSSFIVRVGPLYSRARINQFANRMKIHPGIIVGQLQFRGELSYRSMRDTLVGIRDYVTSESLTDGWGHFLPDLTR
ncbi:HigA family addiction module antitoxin [Rhodopirellula sp. SWK7]|uniref:HigA family addiction module antitoxin n=1 Tax=Rhodopirellula sp. SWK7 TaxID=595460 RepID=UPI0002BDBE35|nr:HigA family addiction module antitoxin [Rhodopirellula sp. SWK7]EMI40547.1 plasmid maintenance system antidote protein, XRE family [Rhodopirellula sp. SWK7]